MRTTVVSLTAKFPSAFRSQLEAAQVEKMIHRKGHSLGVTDFLEWCVNSAKILLYAPVTVALRPSNMRGLYLQDDAEPVRRNQPLFSVPYSSLLSLTSIRSCSRTLSHINEEKVSSFITEEELKMMAPQLTLAIQIACMSYTRDIDSCPNPIERKRMLLEGQMPWCRMIDNEPWLDQQIYNLYRNGLDVFQNKSYIELVRMFGHTMSLLHAELELPYPLEHFRRTARVVIARIDHLPPKNELLLGGWKSVRLARALMRAALRQHPRKDPCIVPLLDLVNHSNRPNCGIRVSIPPGSNEPHVTVFALCEISGGTEVCRNYNFSMDRAAALFRYGFLPYELITIVDHDPWKEHYRDGIYPNLRAESPEKIAENKRIDGEVERLQQMFRSGRGVS